LILLRLYAATQCVRAPSNQIIVDD